MVDFLMHLSPLVLEKDLGSSRNRILAIRRSGYSEYVLPMDNLSDGECEVETLERALRSMCSMTLTEKMGRVGRRLVRGSEKRLTTTEVILCYADGIPAYPRRGFETMWVDPGVLLQNCHGSERLDIIFRNAAALCASPFLEAKSHEVQKLPGCCRTLVASITGSRRSQDIVFCGNGHLVQCDGFLRAWRIPQP